MRQKYIRISIIFVMLFQMYMLGFSQVYAETNNSTKQPEVCAWPSKTMSEYFQFQKDALAAITSSSASNGTLSLWDSDWWLFTRKDLSLPSSALDYVVDNVWWRTSSVISATSTSVVLLMLASASVVESDVEWLAILFKDRPIVRDYKQMLDIETEIFTTAFDFSRKIDLTRVLKWNTMSQFNAVVEQYQASGLLKQWAKPNDSASMTNILSDLISMNASMKFFISVWWEVWASELKSYAWCVWQYKREQCNDSNFVLWFSDESIAKLKEEYSGTRWYWACNSSASNFKNSISKSAKNNRDSIKSAWDDIKTSWHNLVNALIWKWAWSKVLTDPCKLTDYEKAQLEAYYGWDRTCWEWTSVSSVIWQVKKTLAWQSEETDDLSKKSSSSGSPSSLDVVDELNKQRTAEDKNLLWYRVYSGESRYNPEFSNSMNGEFTVIFDDINEQLWHSQRAAMASDLSYELTKFRWLVDQIKSAEVEAGKLEKDLKKIADYQCSM